MSKILISKYLYFCTNCKNRFLHEIADETINFMNRGCETQIGN